MRSRSASARSSRRRSRRRRRRPRRPRRRRRRLRRSPARRAPSPTPRNAPAARGGRRVLDAGTVARQDHVRTRGTPGDAGVCRRTLPASRHTRTERVEMRANVQQALGLKPVRGRRFSAVIAALVLGGALAGTVFSAAGGGGAFGQGDGLWSAVSGKLPAAPDGATADVRPERLDAFKLDRRGMEAMLAGAPTAADRPASMEKTGDVVSLPDPKGGFQRFLLGKSDIMAPGLAAKHPDIATFSGKGIDDPNATIHADLSPLGFHASVRTPTGNWYIDPYYHLDQSLYASYFGHDMPAHARGTVGFVERDASGAELSVDRGYYHAGDDVTLSGSGFPGETFVMITVSDPEENFATRTMSVKTDGSGAFE